MGIWAGSASRLLRCRCQQGPCGVTELVATPVWRVYSGFLHGGLHVASGSRLVSPGSSGLREQRSRPRPGRRPAQAPPRGPLLTAATAPEGAGPAPEERRPKNPRPFNMPSAHSPLPCLLRVHRAEPQCDFTASASLYSPFLTDKGLPTWAAASLCTQHS